MRMIDFTGRVFGALVVVRRDAVRRGYGTSKIVFWEADCACGARVTVSRTALAEGRVRSCGGAACPHHRALMTKPTSEVGPRHMVAMYRAQARNRHIPMTLTNAQIKAMLAAPCHYCGAPPSNVYRHDGRRAAFAYSGIDRVSNQKGYEAENVVPCCWMCNRMKHALPVDAFIAHVRKIAANLGYSQNPN